MKISSYFIVTEPEKMGYPYLEAIRGAVSFSDEVVVVCGRKEKVSENKILNIWKKIKIINTNAWPEKWRYKVMRDHLQIALDACAGDICLKVDADCVFRCEQSKILRNAFNKPKCHRINIGRVNFFAQNIFHHNHNKVIFALNKTLLKEQGIDFSINYTKKQMSNQPYYKDQEGKPVSEENLKVAYIGPKNLWPINYDNTFLNKEQVSSRLQAMVYARREISISNRRSLKSFTIHKKKRFWGRKENEKKRLEWLSKPHHERKGYIENHHPQKMLPMINNITPEMWGYDCFGLFSEVKWSI
jgi:hypothetical protein